MFTDDERVRLVEDAAGEVVVRIDPHTGHAVERNHVTAGQHHAPIGIETVLPAGPPAVIVDDLAVRRHSTVNGDFRFFGGAQADTAFDVSEPTRQASRLLGVVTSAENLSGDNRLGDVASPECPVNEVCLVPSAAAGQHGLRQLGLAAGEFQIAVRANRLIASWNYSPCGGNLPASAYVDILAQRSSTPVDRRRPSFPVTQIDRAAPRCVSRRQVGVMNGRRRRAQASRRTRKRSPAYRR